MASHAERNGPFIFWTVNKIWGERWTFKVTNEEEIGETPNNRRGLYIFYLDDDETRYPIYVGVTARNFRRRFREHYNDGVIFKYINDQFPTNMPIISLPLMVMVIPIDHPMQSKLMESLFLNEFDFCLNSDENGAVRTELDLGDEVDIDTSKHNFDIVFGNVMQEIQEVYDNYNRV